MRETDWLPIEGLVLAGDNPPPPGAVVIDLTASGPNPKLGLVIKTPGGGALLQLNRWWAETKPLHVHPWNNDDVDIVLTGLTARMEVHLPQTEEDALEGHGLLTVGTGGARLHCTNVLARNGIGGRMVVNPHTWTLGAGADTPRQGTRQWRIVAETAGGLIVLCDGGRIHQPQPS